MLIRGRRYFAVLGFLLLATPLVWGMVLPDSPDLIHKEGRKLAPPPAAPADFAGWSKLPGEVDAYLKDRFGLRHAMINLHKDLTHPVLLKVNTAALIGRDGRMFYEGNEMVRQSAGLVLRDQRVAEAVDMIASMRDALARRGIRFLVAIPPIPRPSTRTIFRSGRKPGGGKRNTISFSRTSRRAASRPSICGRR